MSEKKFDRLETESGTYLTTFNKPYMRRKKWAAADPGHIQSFMPGTVEEIMVKEGDTVKEGDVLMVFRAMKMNNNILSPIDGKVKSILVEPGRNLPKNELMIELER